MVQPWIIMIGVGFAIALLTWMWWMAAHALDDDVDPKSGQRSKK